MTQQYNLPSAIVENFAIMTVKEMRNHSTEMLVNGFLSELVQYMHNNEDEVREAWWLFYPDSLKQRISQALQQGEYVRSILLTLFLAGITDINKVKANVPDVGDTLESRRGRLVFKPDLFEDFEQLLSLVLRRLRMVDMTQVVDAESGLVHVEGKSPYFNIVPESILTNPNAELPMYILGFSNFSPSGFDLTVEAL